MKWGMGRLVSAALAILLAGCADQTSSPATVDTELSQLVERTLALKEKVAAAGRMTPELLVQVNVLARM